MSSSSSSKHCCRFLPVHVYFPAAGTRPSRSAGGQLNPLQGSSSSISRRTLFPLGCKYILLILRLASVIICLKYILTIRRSFSHCAYMHISPIIYYLNVCLACIVCTHNHLWQCMTSYSTRSFLPAHRVLIK